MKVVIEPYLGLIKEFVAGNLSVRYFQDLYFDVFKQERRELTEDVYEWLDNLFCELDAYTDDEDFARDNPKYCIDEKRLREIALKTMIALKQYE